MECQTCNPASIATLRSSTSANMPASLKPFPSDTNHALDDFCARMCRKTRSDVSSPGWPQQTGTSPHKRPFTCCSATISSTHDTCSEITTMPMMTTVPPRHPSSPATKQPGKPLPLDYQGGVEVCALHSIGQVCHPHCPVTAATSSARTFLN